ncbi:MAG: arylsulfatase [Lentisphaeraceae bacterium]|nr:arylsulfatase [Lentisphaeraceae bacterium]
MIKILSFISLLLLSLPAAQKPNIIFIMADDLGYTDLGCYGQDKINTPNLNQMAREGMKFTQAYSGSPVCAPARSTLMTGQHTGNTTVRSNTGKGGVVGLGGRAGRIPLGTKDVTVAQVLKEAGYVTGMMGKWGLGEPNTSGVPNKKGFDEFVGFLNQKRAHTYYPDYIWRNDQKWILEGNKEEPKTDYTHDIFTNESLSFIKRHQDKPFFLYIPFCVPHDDYEVPSLGEYKDKAWSQNEKAYAAMVSRMDTNIGKILDLLKELKIDENTYIFFTSDNGAAKRWKNIDSCGPLKGKKRDVYEGGIRVPMIVRAPGKIPANIVNDTPWYFPDVLPTLADIASTKSPKNIDGTSIAPTLKGQTQDLSKRIMYWEFYEKSGSRALRLGDWKAVQYGMNGKPKAIELYNLKNDIGETKNLAKNYPEKVAMALKVFKEYHTPSDHFMWKGKK